MALFLLLSITAEAEQEPPQHASAFDRSRLREASPPTRRGIASRPPQVAPDEDGMALPIVEARVVGDPGDFAAALDEVEPDGAIKTPAPTFPIVDRSARADAFFGLRPDFYVRRRKVPQIDAGPDAPQTWPHKVQNPRDSEFDPGHTMSPARPGDGGQPAPAGLSFDDGATPTPPLAFALNSSTPTSSDGVLVAVEADSAQQTTVAQMSNAGGKPNYAALIDPKDNLRQMRCLAEAIYFESRGEPEQGQAAVAQVVLNRVRSRVYPATVCGVVYQDRNRPFACQFSFACEGRSLRIEEPAPWAVATRIAQEVVAGSNYNSRVGEAVNYHANYVAPFWAGYLRKVDRIGNHIFYAMREGVNWAPGALNGRGDLPPLGN
jgi:spore germination cell wall hydrolase CwlJ-like protein